jgi:hypothetical protein
MKALLRGVIRAYRYLLSPWWGGACRFHPTCSVFAEEAIDRHGALKGTWLAFKRVGRCSPWCAGGFDPVP